MDIGHHRFVAFSLSIQVRLSRAVGPLLGSSQRQIVDLFFLEPSGHAHVRGRARAHARIEVVRGLSKRYNGPGK